MTQSKLAHCIGRRPEVVSRMLDAPGNSLLDTVSDLLFAFSGAEAALTIRYPMAEARLTLPRLPTRWQRRRYLGRRRRAMTGPNAERRPTAMRPSLAGSHSGRFAGLPSG